MSVNVGYPPTVANHPKPLLTPGEVYWIKGIPYRYVQAEDANIAAGNVVCWSSGGANKVTADISGGTSTGVPAGIAQAAITDGYWGLIQVGGLGQVTIVTDGSVAALDKLIPHASTDGGTDTGTPGTNDYAFVALALVADGTGGAATALIAGEYIVINCL